MEEVLPGETGAQEWGSSGSESGVVFTLTSSSSSLNEDDLFEPVSLRDLDISIPDIVPVDVSLRSSFDSELELDTTGAFSNEMRGDHFDSNSCASSSVESPLKPRGRPVTMSDIPPDLVHLVDSVIMGRLDCMEKLKAMVSGADSLEVSRFVVDALLATMGGVNDLDEINGAELEESTPCVMLTSRAAVVAVELIAWLPWEGDSEFYMSPRTRIVKGLLLILNSCTRNRTMCSSSELLKSLLKSTEVVLSESSDRTRWNALPLFYCLQVLGGHSLSVMDLEFWLKLIKKNIVTEWASPLLLSLEHAMGSEEARGPACTFELDGENSGLHAPGENRWPFSNGYAFVTWVYIELLEDASVVPSANTTATLAAGAVIPGENTGKFPSQTPRLFSFVSADNQWVEAHFFGQFLAVEVCAGKGKKKTYMRFSFEFKPQSWYFIGIEQSYKQSLLGKAENEVRLYVNGTLQETRPFELIRTSKPLSFCTIGTNPPPTLPGLQRRKRQCPLFAEIGPIYIFREPIGPNTMARLASRGGDALPLFGKGAGSPWLAVNEHARSLAAESSVLDADIAGSLHLLYHPRLLSGCFCPDASPTRSAGIQRRHAEVLGQVSIASRVRSTESLWALANGGPMALLLLIVSHVQMDSLDPKLNDPSIAISAYSLSASIFRIISIASQHPGNAEELYRTKAPELLQRVLHYLLNTRSNSELEKRFLLSDEDLVSAITFLCQNQKCNYSLKVQFFGTLLLDMNVWGKSHYGLQKRLLSSLADLVFTESAVLRDANALKVLLDGCRRCFWVIHEDDSIDTFSLNGGPRPLGEVNALVDELLVVIELLMGAASISMVNEDIRCLLGFMIYCPQPNQVARALHLVYRLIVQPNVARAQFFAHSLISCGGVETLLVLLQREAKIGNHDVMGIYKPKIIGSNAIKENSVPETAAIKARAKVKEHEFFEQKDMINGQSQSMIISASIAHTSSATSESQFAKCLGGIRFSINAESSRSNVFNIDDADGIVVAIINLIGVLVSFGHLKFNSNISSSNLPNDLVNDGLFMEGSTMFDDKVSLLLFALQRALQAAPRRLMTSNAIMAFLAVSVKSSSSDDELNLYDCGHHIENVQLMAVLLRALPYASRTIQIQTIQDLLFLACSHPDNRRSLTSMEEWPEWILEVLISNYEMASARDLNDESLREIEDLIHNCLIIILEHSMRQKDGWKDVEATIHCAEWLSMVGGSSTGALRIRREEALPIFRRRLLGGLLDFAAWELTAQTQIVAAAVAGVTKASPQAAKTEAEHAAQLTVALVENSIVILMLVEDHLRSQGQCYCSSNAAVSKISSANFSNFSVAGSRMASASSRDGRVSLDDLSLETDENGVVYPDTEGLTAAPEPFSSVRCAFVCYGSCVLDLDESWKQRSRMWYAIGLPLNTTFGAGASGRDSWNSVLEKDTCGKWIELTLVKKSVIVLQSLLLDESIIGRGLAIGGGSGIGMNGLNALYHLLDSDQPFLCMLRLILLSMREEDDGEDDIFVRTSNINGALSERKCRVEYAKSLTCGGQLSFRKLRSALLWSVLGPVLNMPISESKRQRVLVTCCVIYSEVWHAIGRDRKPIRKQYINAILPPFVAVLRRWRPILAGIHELTPSEVDNPLIADEHALSADVLPLEAALSMITPGWSATFASPPAAMALAMIAAGASGGETQPNSINATYRRETSLFERKSTRLHTFSSFQRPLETSNDKSPSVPKDKAAAKAAALAAVRDLERNAKIGSGRGLCAVAMATSAQRRSLSDLDRSRRWNIAEAMAAAWTECLHPFNSRSVSSRDFSSLCYKYVAVLVTSFALARNMLRMEMERLAHVNMLVRYRANTGIPAWRKLICCLLETNLLFGHFGDQLSIAKPEFLKLDMTESSCRMRRLVKRSYKKSLYEDYVHDKSMEVSYDQLSLITNDLPYAEAIMAPKVMPMKERDENGDQIGHGIVHDKVVRNHLQETNDPALHGELFSRKSCDFADQILPQPTSYGLALEYEHDENDERIILDLPSLMVRPSKVVCGTFQITCKRINFIAEKHTTDECIAESLAASEQDRKQGRNRSWLISSLYQIFRRRYLVRNSALEIFMADRSNYFFDFGNNEACKNAFHAIIQAQPPQLQDIFFTEKRPDQILKCTRLMERWARWEISNFEYLMELNTLAGRSYNDVTQYPIFPWILSDYHSKTLNLDDPSSYRDLSKPIGALNPDRLKKFQEKYSTFDDTITLKFHYGSHYSSVRTVLHFLMRVEPFATLSAKYRDGFNHMLNDIGHSWNNALEDMNDVKELVPEMFYLPEILTNENFFDAGTNHSPSPQDSVKLPPWADNPTDFIYKHRRALESEHVSLHLHEWIDLIFGYKQRGEEAEVANNLFFYTSYDGAINIDKITDLERRREARKIIAYFGQVPSQLLTAPHLKRKPLSKTLMLQTIFQNPNEVRSYAIPHPEQCNVPAAAIYASPDSIVVVDSLAPAANVVRHQWRPNAPDGHGKPFQFSHGMIAASSNGGAFARIFKGPAVSAPEDSRSSRVPAFAAIGIRSAAIVAVTRDKEIITGGHADNSIKLISSDQASTIETAFGHCAPVTCLALSPDSNHLITGSRDSTVILWRILRADPHSSSPKTSNSSLKCSNISETIQTRIKGPIRVFRGHRGEIICCALNSDVGIAASSSSSAGVLLHSLRNGRLLQKLDVFAAQFIGISSQGVVVIWNDMEKRLSTFTASGFPIAAVKFSSFLGTMSCFEISADGEIAVIGFSSVKDNKKASRWSSIAANLSHKYISNAKGLKSCSFKPAENGQSIPIPSICFINLHSLKIIHSLPLSEGQDPTCFALDENNTNIIVSTADKQLIIFANPAVSMLNSQEHVNSSNLHNAIS